MLFASFAVESSVLAFFACVSDSLTLGNTGKYSHSDGGRQLLTSVGVCPVLCVLTDGVIVMHVCLQSDLKALAKAEEEKKTSTFVQQETNPISSKHSKILTLSSPHSNRALVVQWDTLKV